MNAISRFTIEQHDGPYKTWPLRSRLFLDGEPTGISLPGYVLLHQFETSEGYVLVTDYDCPFEEITNFILLNKKLRLQSWMYESFSLQRIEWLDDCTFIAVVYHERRYRFILRSWWIPYIRPRLKMKYLGKAACEDHGEAKENESSRTSR